MGDLQAVTFLEAVVLLVSNSLGAALAFLAWRASAVDVREAQVWEPPTESVYDRQRLRHNRWLVVEDQRHGEAGRLLCHGLVALVGVFWLLTPQPANPQVVSWAVMIRATTIALSLVMIEATVHHLIARWRFDRPGARDGFSKIGLALLLAWRDWRDGGRRG